MGPVVSEERPNHRETMVPMAGFLCCAALLLSYPSSVFSSAQGRCLLREEFSIRRYAGVRAEMIRCERTTGRWIGWLRCGLRVKLGDWGGLGLWLVRGVVAGGEHQGSDNHAIELIAWAAAWLVEQELALVSALIAVYYTIIFPM